MAFLLLGQTDAGKSTVAGHLLYKVGFFNKLNDSLGKTKYSSLLDIFEEEQEQGKTKTHEFSHHKFQYDNKEYTLIDTPGHLIYIRALIEGLYSTKINLIVLVISSIADEFTSSFERGTVKEDLLLARSIGCSNLLVLWNKIDLIETHTHSKDNQNLLDAYVKKLRYKRINHLDVSGWTGENLLNMLSYIESNNIISDEEKKDEGNGVELKLTCAFYLPENEKLVITRGFICILHHKSGEYEMEIKRINGKTKIIITDMQCIIDVKLNKPMIYSMQDKIIMRKNKYTIGYGFIS